MSTNFPEDLNKLHEFLADLLDVQTNDEILDVGSGKGITLQHILPKCGQGKVCGIDIEESAIEHSRSLFTNFLDTEKLELKIGDIAKGIPYQDGQFDKIISHNVIECVEDRVGLVNEMFRVLKPGGVMILSHNDFDSQIYNTNNLSLTRTLIHLFADTKQEWMDFSDPIMGRKLFGLVSQSKFNSCEPITYTLTNTKFEKGNYGYDRAMDMVDIAKEKIPKKALDSWIDDLKLLNETREYFYSVTTFIMRAVKH